MNDTLPNSRDPLSVVEPSGLLGDVLQAPRTVLWGMVAAFVVYQLLKVAKVSKSGKLPPGPKGVPFFGNLFQLSKDAWVTFAEWGKQYGASDTFIIWPSFRLTLHTYSSHRLHERCWP